jgi:type I restriction enzyme M protein
MIDFDNDDRFALPECFAEIKVIVPCVDARSTFSSKGRAAIVCFPGISTVGAEQRFRKYLVDNNL